MGASPVTAFTAPVIVDRYLRIMGGKCPRRCDLALGPANSRLPAAGCVTCDESRDLGAANLDGRRGARPAQAAAQVLSEPCSLRR